LGHGTTFKVYLPQVKASVSGVREVMPAAPLHGAETVMVVEDEDGIRTLECRILEKHGYTVLRASNGAEAIQVSAQHNGKIELLITDMVMPSMSGTDLAQLLTSQRSELKVLFTSGYTDNAIIHHGTLTGDAEFLAKPFEPQALARKVREVLDNHPEC
jgi:DNA-binding NtrC family response regulator